jgi:hypothetical protein
MQCVQTASKVKLEIGHLLFLLEGQEACARFGSWGVEASGGSRSSATGGAAYLCGGKGHSHCMAHGLLQVPAGCQANAGMPFGQRCADFAEQLCAQNTP